MELDSVTICIPMFGMNAREGVVFWAQKKNGAF